MRMGALGRLLRTQHSKLHSLFVFSERVYTHFPRVMPYGSHFSLETRGRDQRNRDELLDFGMQEDCEDGDTRNAPGAPAFKTTLYFCVF